VYKNRSEAYKRNYALIFVVMLLVTLVTGRICYLQGLRDKQMAQVVQQVRYETLIALKNELKKKNIDLKIGE